jgi:acetyl esterase
MPIEPSVAARLHLLEGLSSWDEAAADTEQAARLRAFLAAGRNYVGPRLRVEDSHITGRHGAIPIRIYQPLGSRPIGPGLVWLHGGGFTGGDLDTPEADTVSREVAYRAQATVISVHYRVAVGGVHYPTPLDDVVDAYGWSVEHADSLGIDPAMLVVGGASAGANLAAAAALVLRDQRGANQPRVVLLVYPPMHRELPQPSPEFQAKLEVLPAITRIRDAAYSAMMANYIGDRDDDRPTYAVPIEADLAGFPRTVLVTSEYDDLAPSGVAFAEKLRAAGATVSHTEIEGMLHGHLNEDPGIPAVQESFALLADAVMSCRTVKSQAPLR